uniref:Glycoside hydrolase family 65 central catalytic domain-containing protein n=1 Tax=Periophthalmus magnuspinnatus TaxID=409849 RepID=A0A3B3Z7L1_9GOBI
MSFIPLRHIFGHTTAAEYPGGSCPTVHLIWTDIPVTLTLNAGQSQARWGFILVVAESLQSAESNYDKGLSLMAGGSLRSSHEQAWKELWLQSKIDVVGSEILCKALIGCMFYLLSAFPSIHDTTRSFGGVSPGGLSNGGDGQDYWGHVFWDQDIWMYPGIALFYPTLARSVLEYRVRTIDGARDNAQRQGYKGIKFPWESAVSGREVCPEDIYGQQEIHINGDVTLAFQHYLYLTEDISMFTEGQGSQVVWGIADYWISRVTWSPQDHKYHILGVMPPDEYYYNVNNSVYTNIVRAALHIFIHITFCDILQGMFAIGWLELGEAERAQHLLVKCFNNIQGPFQVWSESSDGSGAVNFLTGMGGFLQAVLFGYTGFRLVFRTCLCIRGVNYLGNQLDWMLRKEEISIILRGSQCSEDKATKSYDLQVILKGSGSKIPLLPGVT